MPPVDDELFRGTKLTIATGSFTCSGIVYIRPNDGFRFGVEREIAFHDDRRKRVIFLVHGWYKRYNAF